MDPNTITAHLLRRAQWWASRSSGPGGQHRDKASTRAELTLGADSLEGLDEAVAARLASALGLGAGPVRIAVQRLHDRVAKALAPPPPPRRPTRATRAARRERLEAKTRRASIKRLRQAPADESG